MSNNIPSLSSSAMLVEVSISIWTGRKKDKRASEDVTMRNHAQRDAASVSKSLLKCEPLSRISTIAGEARNHVHYRMTLPWSDMGYRLLPTPQYFKYVEAITAKQTEFYQAVEDFLRVYDWEVTQAEARLGDLFNREEYPSEQQLRNKFGFTINYLPVPDTGDFRVEIGDQQRDALREQYELYQQTQMERAMNDLWERTYTALAHMSEKLDFSGGDKKRLYDSMIDNVLEITDLLDTCNITGDEDMKQRKRELENALRGVTKEALKEDAGFRKHTKEALDEIIQKLPGLG